MFHRSNRLSHCLGLLGVCLATQACIIEDDWDDDDPWHHSDDCPDDDKKKGDKDRCLGDEEAIYLLKDSPLCDKIDFTCPTGQRSFSDSCGCGCILPDPTTQPKTCPETDKEGAWYLSQNAQVCSAINFTCPTDYQPFSSDCGCGCEPKPDEPAPTPMCPDATVPGVRYLCTNPTLCEQIEFTCPEGESSFSGGCGCGCIAPNPDSEPTCPDPDAEGVIYLSTEACETVEYTCPMGSQPFTSSCGCGCEPG